MPIKKLWVDFEHPEYEAVKNKLIFTRDHYDGTVLDPLKIDKYLIKRSQSENEAAFNERKKIADYTNHFATAVDSLAGMLFAVDDQAERIWTNEAGMGLGAPADPNSIMHTLWNDADGQDTNWLTLWRTSAIELVHSQWHWVLVDGAEGTPRTRVIPALDVPNWRNGTYGPTDVLLKETADVRGDIRSEASAIERYVLFQLDGWKRFEVDRETKNPKAVEIEAGPYTYTTRGGQPMLPIFRVRLPMPRPVGWSLAKKANAIFNRESDRDNIIRTANFPFLVMVTTDTTFAEMTERIAKEGSRVLQEDPQTTGSGHRFIAPDSGPAEIATKVLERKVDEFYVTAFQMYGDAAREKTATEVRQDVAAGVGAFLQYLRSAVDDAENGALYRVEQTVFADSGKWDIVKVKRSGEFIPLDASEFAANLATRYIGKDETVPVGRTGMEEVIRKITEFDNIILSDEEIEQAVDLLLLRQTFDAFSALPWPAEARADFVIKHMVAVGHLDPDAKVEGGEEKRIDVLRGKALELAEAEDADRRNMLSGGFGV